MTSVLPASAFNVFRWSALGVGVVYGVFHRNTLSKQAERKRLQAEYAHKEELIKEARAEYQRRKNSNAGPTEINWNDSKSIEDAIQRFSSEK